MVLVFLASLTYYHYGIGFSEVRRSLIRPGKLDSLSSITHLLDLHVGGWSLFIIHY